MIAIIERAVRRGASELDLSEERLTTLPAQIGRLTKLDTLEVGFNPLGALPSEGVAKWIAKMTKKRCAKCGKTVDEYSYGSFCDDCAGEVWDAGFESTKQHAEEIARENERERREKLKG